MRNAALMTVALVLLCSTPVLAGGGGAKKNATLRVVNNGGGQIAVLVDPSDNDVAFFAIPGNATEANLKARGGRIVNAGARTDFLVTPNAPHRIFAAFTADVALGPDLVAATGDEGSIAVAPAVPANGSVSAFKQTGGPGSVTTFTVTGNPGAPPVIVKLLLDLGREFALAGFGLSGLGAIVLAGYMLSRKS